MPSQTKKNLILPCTYLINYSGFVHFSDVVESANWKNTDPDHSSKPQK